MCHIHAMTAGGSIASILSSVGYFFYFGPFSSSNNYNNTKNLMPDKTYKWFYNHFICSSLLLALLFCFVFNACFGSNFTSQLCASLHFWPDLSGVLFRLLVLLGLQQQLKCFVSIWMNRRRRRKSIHVLRGGGWSDGVG